MHRLLKCLLVGGSLVSIITLVGTVSFRVAVNRRIEQQVAIATQILSPLVIKGATETNATARQLNLLLAEIEPQVIGSQPPIETTGETESKIADSRPLHSQSELAFHQALTQYYSDLQATTAGPIPTVPETVRLGLSERAQTLSRIKTLLLDEPLPVWAFDASKTSTVEPISMMGFAQAHRLHGQLLALSLLNQQQGNTVKSRRYFQAARRLHDAVIRYPVNGIYVGLSMAEQRVMVTRWTNIPEPIVAVDYGAKLLESRQYESAISTRTHLLALQAGGPQANAIQARFEQPLLGPRGNHFLALSYIDSHQTHRQAHRVLSEHFKQNGPCDAQQLELPTLASWNGPLQQFNPNSSALNRVAQVQLTAELNTLIAEVHAIYDRNQRWPEALSTTHSQVCAGNQWQYEETPQGITISYSGTPDPDEQNTNAALTYSAQGQASPIAFPSKGSAIAPIHHANASDAWP